MKLSTMNEWLVWINQIHFTEIELGLARIQEVGEKMSLFSFACPIITVAGTNGKGSTVAALESIYLAHQYSVGAFTSPFLFSPNEQIRLNGQAQSDAQFCQAFDAIEKARMNISLTAFEYFTLAALWIFKNSNVDVVILEVGLGGRLDAVNVMDADVAIITSIALDHVAWLGNTREAIGYEKAGIFRKNCPAICGDQDPPASLIEHARAMSSPLFIQQKDFFYDELPNTFRWQYKNVAYEFPYNGLMTQNVSTALMAINCLEKRLPVQFEKINQGLAAIQLKGRCQFLFNDGSEIYDVAHNPAAVSHLAHLLRNSNERKVAVFSMLEDKDISASIREIKNEIDEWYVSVINHKRGATMAQLMLAFQNEGIKKVNFFDSIERAYQTAKKNIACDETVVIFGSFHTVSEILCYTQSK